MQISYFKRYRMQIDLSEAAPSPPKKLPEGFAFLPWHEDLLEAHAQAKYQSFQYELDCNVFPCLGNEHGCERLMNEISSRRGFVPQATWLLRYIDPESGRQTDCGTVQGIREQPDVGCIQNIGIVPEFRGRGLGSAIVSQCVQGFASTGVRFVNLEVTANNTRAHRLYQRLGFRLLKVVFKSVEVPLV